MTFLSIAGVWIDLIAGEEEIKIRIMVTVSLMKDLEEVLLKQYSC